MGCWPDLVNTELNEGNKMSDIGKNTTIIYAPRSIGVLLIQTMSIAPLMTALLVVVAFVVSTARITDHDTLILLLEVFFGLLSIAFIMLYFPQRYLTQLVFNDGDRSLTKVKRGDETMAFDLAAAQRIVSKRVFTNPGTKFLMIIEDNLGRSQVIFDEDPLYGGRHWVALSGKLSHVTGIPIKDELWAEDMNGKLSSLFPQERLAINVRRRLFPSLIPIALAFVGAVLFRMHPTFKYLLFVGLVTVAVNTAISLAYAILNKDKMGDLGNSYFLLVVAILTLIIPYSFFYLIFAFLLNGFSLPVSQ